VPPPLLALVVASDVLVEGPFLLPQLVLPTRSIPISAAPLDSRGCATASRRLLRPPGFAQILIHDRIACVFQVVVNLNKLKQRS
jgi:hypothetical protein